MLREGLKKNTYFGGFVPKGRGGPDRTPICFSYLIWDKGGLGGGQNHIIHIYFLVEKCKKESPYGLFEVFFDIVIQVTFNSYHI